MRSMKLKKNKIFIIIGSILMVCMITVIGLMFINRNKTNSFVNINQLSPEYIEKYFGEYEKIGKKDNKSNILIVTTKEQLEETYGATDIIEAPNNQYFLQYDTEEEKEQALKKFNTKNSKIDVSENLVREISEDTVLVANYNSWGVESMGIDTLLNEFENKELNNVTVAIIDTGLDVNVFNETFSGRLAGVYNVLDNNDNMYDNNGHGTHIAGTIAESTPDSVKILPIKVTDSRDMYETDIITAINYITYNKNADVINMSFGSYEYSKSEYIAIEAAKENNIISVAAAGNDNSSELHYPSAMDNTISIAAVDSNKEKATFSNYGDSIMFTSPGVNIKSIASKEENQVMSGTSMATPHAAGAIAILKSLNKTLTFDDTITILRRYSDDLGDISWDEYFGYGFINFSEADICDGTNCDEYNVFKKSERDSLDDIVESYKIEPILTTYNYGTINNILNTKVIIQYTNGKLIEYQLCNIKNLEMSEYDPYSLDKQTINIKFTTSLGMKIDDAFEITNPSNYESVWEYKTVGNNNVEITNYKDTSFTGNTLYFPSIIDGYNVIGIADGDTSIFAATWDSFIKVQNLYLPSTLTKIGNNAFSNSNLINGLNYVKSDAESLIIGNSAFRGSQSLYKLEATISYVGDYAFSYAMSLPGIQFSDDITHIGEGAFQIAFYEAKITIPESVTEIGTQAFYGSGLKEIEFLNNMEVIPSQMMYKNINLEKVTLSEEVKEIGESAFSECKKLTTINLPESLTTIGEKSFYKSFNEGALTIPKNVTTIGDKALFGSGLKEIKFLNSMEVIPSQMMYDNSNLEKVTLSEGLKEIGESAFYGCEKLVTIILPESLTTIGKSAFQTSFDSTKDVLLEIPKNVESIGILAFSKSGLKEVKFLGSVENLSTSIFNASSKLEKVTLPEKLKKISGYAFADCTNLVTINLPEGLTTIGNRAFSGTFKTENSVKITIPESVTEIGTEVFYGSGLKEIEFLNSMEVIPSQMMYNNSKLEKVTLPEGIKQIGEGAFYGCKKLIAINLSESVTTIEENAFFGAFDVESKVKITIPESVTTIGERAFQESNIVEVNIGKGVKELPNSVFDYSVYLEKVILPESLTIIRSSFYGCTSLKEVYFGKNITSIDDSAFDDIEADLKFYVYNNTVPKTYAKSKSIDYVQIDPDVILIKNIKSQYSAFEKVNKEEISLELTYNEKTTRFETITENIEIEYPDLREDFRYGDNSIKVITYNKLGYKIEKTLEIEVAKAIPNYEVPKDLVAEIGQELYNIQLPDNFEWSSDNITFEEIGNQKFIARYIPEDTVNYETVENIEINIAVEYCKKVINPTIKITDKTFNGDKIIDNDTIIITELSKTDYTIVFAQTLTENVGKTTAKVLIKLSDDKFKDYTFEGNVQEKEFDVSVNIIPKTIKKPALVEKKYTYNTLEQTVELNNYQEDKMNISGNKRKNAGEQEVTISLKNNNYIWNDNSSDDVILKFEIEKATPEYTIPINLTADVGQKLSEITLPDNFEWMNPDEIIEQSENPAFKAKYIPSDDENYKIIENIEITITVNQKKYAVTFDANGGKFAHDETTIVIDEWEDSKLESLEKPTKQGYTFKGYYTEKEGGTSIDSYIAEAGIDQDGLIFYAQWAETYSYIINKYSVDVKTKIISGISINTTEEQFKSNVDLNAGYTMEIIKQKDKINIGTNTLIKIYKNELLYIEFTAIVKGDITGDGLISLADLSKFYNYYKGNITMNKYFELSADVKEDGKFSLADLSKFYNYYQGKINKL